MKHCLALLLCLFVGLIIGCAQPEPEPEGTKINIDVPGFQGEIDVPPAPKNVDVDVRGGRVDVDGTHVEWKKDEG